MAYQLCLLNRYQRDCESIGRPEPLNYCRFSLVTVFCTVKGPCRHIGDGGVIALLLVPYYHRV